MGRRKLSLLVNCALVPILSACGGGSGGAGGVISTPTLPIAYTPVLLLTDRSHQLSGAFLRLTRDGSKPLLVPAAQGLVITYDKAAQTYSINSAIDGTSDAFGPADFKGRTDGRETWIKADGDVTKGLFIDRDSSLRLSYTMFGNWYWHNPRTGSLTNRSFVTGSPTLDSDLPKGSASYSVKITGSSQVSADGSSGLLDADSRATLTADFSSGKITTTLALSHVPFFGAPSVDFGNFSGSAQIDSGASTFNGLFSGSRGTGSFAGGFFGPQAAEAGYVWHVTGDTFVANGGVAGKKD